MTDKWWAIALGRGALCCATVCSALSRVLSESDRQVDLYERTAVRGRCLCLSGASRLNVGGPAASEMDSASTLVGVVMGGRLVAWFIGILRSVPFLSLFRLCGAATCPGLLHVGE